MRVLPGEGADPAVQSERIENYARERNWELVRITEDLSDLGGIAKLVGIVTQVHVSNAVQRYAVALTTATRRSNDLTLGASPRATLHLVRAAKASAAMSGRDYVLPDDVHALAKPVLTGIPEEVCRAVNLGYRDPGTIDVAAFAADPDTLVVPRAGEVLFRLR